MGIHKRLENFTGPVPGRYNQTLRNSKSLFIAIVVTAIYCSAATAYPLDGYDYTGIARLEAQRLVQEGALSGKKRPPGELLPLDMVELKLIDRPDFELPVPDPEFTESVKHLIGEDLGRYSMALLDLSDPDNPRYAEWQGEQRQNPGSVGKLMVGLAIFQALADIYPDDLTARLRVLRHSQVCADDFSLYDHHTVPFWHPQDQRIERRPIAPGDCASLWTYLDWMMSPSSNSAAGMLQKHLILLTHFGRQYPVSEERSKKFFSETTASERGAIFLRAIQNPVTRNGMNLETLRQGSFFTRGGKQRVPGTSSHATTRGLMQFMVKMEQGKLVDYFSSRELKRLLYITERRIRYASSAILHKSAVYFKSGSLYSCKPEPGFKCKKYHGNERNYMNSVAIIESPAGQNRLYYMTAVLSNVLRKNSAVDHRDLAGAIHNMLLNDHPRPETEDAEHTDEELFGKDFIGYEHELKQMKTRLSIQEALLALEYDIGEMDGIIGPRTQAAIVNFQRSQGLVADGLVTEDLVRRMREEAIHRGLLRNDP